MLIECSYCDSKVDAKILSKHIANNPEWGPDERTYFLECPSCRKALIGVQECYGYDPSVEEEIWSDIIRVYPSPKRAMHNEIPEIVRCSMEEAEKCFKARAYTAAVVMSGRALEAICSYYNTSNKMLQKGLLELKEKEIIDKRLYEWGEEIRKHRNIGAHASDLKITKDDAEDVLNFIMSMCEYIFVLTVKFQKFCDRQRSRSIV